MDDSLQVFQELPTESAPEMEVESSYQDVEAGVGDIMQEMENGGV